MKCAGSPTAQQPDMHVREKSEKNEKTCRHGLADLSWRWAAVTSPKNNYTSREPGYRVYRGVLQPAFVLPCSTTEHTTAVRRVTDGGGTAVRPAGVWRLTEKYIL